MTRTRTKGADHVCYYYYYYYYFAALLLPDCNILHRTQDLSDQSSLPVVVPGVLFVTLSHAGLVKLDPSVQETCRKIPPRLQPDAFFSRKKLVLRTTLKF